MWCPARLSHRTTVVHDLYDPSCFTTQTSWHDLYADDPQLFQELSLSDNTSPEIAIRKMERCVISIRQWMKTNMLKLNDDKTEILIILPKSAHQHHLPESVRIGNTNMTPNTHARNLGVTFDCNMSPERHVTNISGTAYYHLHSIGRIRRCLEQGHTKQLVHALVISRIDCCNSLLNGLSVAVFEQLQRYQNASLYSCYINSIETRPCHAHALGAALASC